MTLPFEVGARVDFISWDRSLPEGKKEGEAEYRLVTRGYFEALKIDLVRGRLVDDQDRHSPVTDLLPMDPMISLRSE